MSILGGLLAPSVRAAEGDKLRDADYYYGGAYWGDVGSGRSISNERVNPTQAMTISAYWAAINIISGAIGFMPTVIYRRINAHNKERAPDYPSYNLLRMRPHQHVDALTFKEAMQANALSWGNGYAEIIRDGGGMPLELRILQPSRTQPRIGKSGLYYETQEDDGYRHNIPWEDVLHIRGMGGDGYTGQSVANRARETLGIALAAEKTAAAFYGNNALPGGYLSHPHRLSPEAADNLRRRWNDIHRGAANAGKAGVLEEGVTWTAASMPMKDAQFLESRKFQVTEIARWFQIPPHYLADLERATFSNIEHQGLQFVTMTLMRHVVRWEMEIWYKLIMPGDRAEYFPEFIPDALLRGDLKSRYDAYHLAIMDGHLNRNEVRALENRNWVPGLDEYLVPQNLAPASAAAGAAGSAGAAGGAAGGEAAADVPAMLECLRPCALDAFARWCTRQDNAVKRAAEKYAAAPDGFTSWANEWFDREPATLADMLAGVLQSVVALGIPDAAERLREFCRVQAALVRHSLHSLSIVDDWIMARNSAPPVKMVDALFHALTERCNHGSS